ncbi:MAG: hypothetical protein WD894_18260 [Pirellulales bacterium]
MAAVADKVWVFPESAEAGGLAGVKLAAEPQIEPLPGRDAGGGLTVEDKAVRASIGEILVDRVGLLAIKFSDDADVLVLTLAAGLPRYVPIILDQKTR